MEFGVCCGIDWLAHSSGLELLSVGFIGMIWALANQEKKFTKSFFLE
jgi:hypothetical protein